MLFYRLLLVLLLIILSAVVPWSLLVGFMIGIAVVFPFLFELVFVGVIMDAFALAPFGLWSASVMFFLLIGAFAKHLLRQRNIAMWSVSAFAAILFWETGMRLMEVFMRISVPHIVFFSLPSALLLFGAFIGLGISYVFYETQTKTF